MLGFHARISNISVEISNCRLIQNDLLAAVPIIQDLASIATSRKGELKAQVTKSQAGLDIAIESCKKLNGNLLGSLSKIAEAHKSARLTCDNEGIATHHVPSQRFGVSTVVLPTGCFLQANEVDKSTYKKL